LLSKAILKVDFVSSKIICQVSGTKKLIRLIFDEKNNVFTF
jgi:hypothetical protein